jgi:isoquinoline 1-oxidoreductase beta subunit
VTRDDQETTMLHPVSVDRRRFIASSSAGLVLGFTLDLAGPSGEARAAGAAQVNSWLAVGSDNSVTLTIGASDMGQGSVQGLAQVLAEDLMVDPLRVSLVQGQATLATPAPIGTAINTVGSGVTRGNYWRLRDAAAIARETLVQAAMNRVGDGSRANYGVVDGTIVHSSGARLTYGQVAADAALLKPPASAPLVPDSEFKSIGRALPRQDILLKVNGSAKYGIDTRLPGMVYAVIKHCPTFGGKLAATPAVPAGALAVVPVSVAAGTGRGAEAAGNVNAVAVVASTTWDAMQAARRLSVKWSLPANASAMNSAQFLADAQALAAKATPYVAGGTNGPGTLYTVEASTADAQATIALPGTRVVQATYTLPYASHGCLEVLNCAVDYVAGTKCDVYAPTQSARSALSLVVALTGLQASQVSVKTTLLGGGLGRKSEHDFIAQALQVGMALQRPVMLVWPREEDFAHDQYRPMALVAARAGLDASGQVTSWIYRNVSPSILGQRGAVLGPRGDSQGYEASAELPYAFGSRLVEWVSHPSPVPVGFWRSVGASINTFVVESFVDELAAAAGQDGFQFRRARLTDARWLAVLEAAAALGNWSSAPRSGSARGIAIGKAFNTIVAAVVEVSGTSATSFKVQRVSLAVDPYLTVNPANVEAQIVGGVVHGLNAALYGQQTFSNGAAQRKNFNTNPVIRLQQMPAVAVTIMPRPAQADRTVAIGGIGELGVPTLAPALANAVFRLCGTRVRNLPFFPTATMGGL